MIEKLQIIKSTKISWIGCVKRPNNQNDETKPTECFSDSEAKQIKIKENTDENPNESIVDYYSELHLEKSEFGPDSTTI